MRLFFPLAALCGCTFTGAPSQVDPDASSPDAGADAADAMVELVWNVRAITSIEVAGGSYDDPSIANGRFYWAENLGSNENIRSGVLDPLSLGVIDSRLEGLDDGDESNPVVSGDALHIAFVRFGPSQIFESRRSSTAATWSTPSSQALAGLTAGNAVGLGALSEDLTEIFFSMRVGGADANFDLYRATRPNPGSNFDFLELVAELSGTENEFGARLSGDGLRITFHRGNDEQSSFFISTRDNIGSPFTAPEPFAFDPNERETDLWLSDDGTEALFTRGPNSDRHIFHARLVPASR